MKRAERCTVRIINRNRLRDLLFSLAERHAADVDARDRNAALHHADDVLRTDEQEEHRLLLIFWIVVDADCLLNVDDVHLDARRCDLLEQLRPNLIRRNLVAADDDAPRPRLMRPDGRDCP